jgi:nucleoside-diphosphate-sugar epimerase
MVQGELDGDEQVMRLVDGCDAVVHCAVGKEWGNRRRNFEINVDGSLRLAKAALAAGVRRFVHFSTISIYGDEGRLTGVLDEAMPPRPMKSSDYGQSKAASEQAVLSVAQEGLNAAIFRPARAFGPFSGIFVNNPLAAMAERRFHWLGDPNVPCDMIYVDNVVHAVVRALASPDGNVRGQIFNVGEGDTTTWREFYDYFARRLDFDLAEVEIDDPAKTRGRSNKHGLWGGLRTVVVSREFRALGRRVLDTDPIGAVPRWALNRFPAIERAARKIVRADGSLPVYRREPVRSSEIVHMGSGGAVASIDKARRLLDYAPLVPRERALELTLAWARHARIV